MIPIYPITKNTLTSPETAPRPRYRPRSNPPHAPSVMRTKTSFAWWVAVGHSSKEQASLLKQIAEAEEKRLGSLVSRSSHRLLPAAPRRLFHRLFVAITEKSNNF